MLNRTDDQQLPVAQQSQLSACLRPCQGLCVRERSLFFDLLFQALSTFTQLDVKPIAVFLQRDVLTAGDALGVAACLVAADAEVLFELEH